LQKKSKIKKIFFDKKRQENEIIFADFCIFAATFFNKDIGSIRSRKNYSKKTFFCTISQKDINTVLTDKKNDLMVTANFR